MTNALVNLKGLLKSDIIFTLEEIGHKIFLVGMVLFNTKSIFSTLTLPKPSLYSFQANLSIPNPPFDPSKLIWNALLSFPSVSMIECCLIILLTFDVEMESHVLKK